MCKKVATGQQLPMKGHTNNGSACSEKSVSGAVGGHSRFRRRAGSPDAGGHGEKLSSQQSGNWRDREYSGEQGQKRIAAYERLKGGE